MWLMVSKERLDRRFVHGGQGKAKGAKVLSCEGVYLLPECSVAEPDNIHELLFIPVVW